MASSSVEAASPAARYRLYLIDWSLPRGRQKKEIERDLGWSDVNEKRDAGNARLKAEGKDGFSGQLYGVELTNGWDCMTDAARARHRMLGKGPADFNC